MKSLNNTYEFFAPRIFGHAFVKRVDQWLAIRVYESAKKVKGNAMGMQGGFKGNSVTGSKSYLYHY